MNIIVLGSGVVGVATAWYLRQSGHDVTVIDRESDVAQGTSAGNAGQISPGYAAPWAAPGIPFKAVKWMFEKHAPLSIRPDGTQFQLSWMWQMLMNCNANSYSENKGRMVRLAEYSRDCMKLLRADTGLTYEDRQRGTLQIFRTDDQYKNAAKDISVLQDAGVAYELLGPDQLAAAEPALAAVAHKLTGGLRLPNDETGDCQLFTQRLAKMAEAAGVKFKFNTSIDAIQTQNNAVTGILSNGELLTADAYVVALGSFSKGLLKGLVDIPVYPVKGYSLTIPIADPAGAPTSTVLDETYKIALTRFDQRIRVGGMAELVGFSDELLKARRETLEMVTQDLFPTGGHIEQATFWTGLRPMTPDGTPIIGQCGVKNLWLNTGHGTLGWTMACGSGKLLSDMVSESKPEIAYQDLNLSRYVA